MATDDSSAPTPVAPSLPLGETRELRILYQVAAALSRSLQLGDLLADALQTIEGLLGIPMSAVYLLDAQESEPVFVLRAHRGFSAEFDVQTLDYDPAAAWFRTVITDVRPYVTRERLEASEGQVSPREKREGVQSWAMIPLLSRGRVLGVLLVASRGLDKFPPDEVELLETLAPDLGVAIENAQLFELVQRGRDEWLHTFDAVEDRLAALDSKLRITRANRALLSSLARPPAEIIGKTCVEVFPELCATDCPHQAALVGGRIERVLRLGSATLSVITYPTGTGGVIHAAKDVSAERRREEQMVQAERLSAASTVLAGVAHELNNPLTVVIAYADLLSQSDETQSFREELQQILRGAMRCQSIVRNLFAFSRQDSPQRSDIDLNQLVRETLHLFTYQFRVAGTRIEERLSPATPTISADRARLQVVLVNLLSNAQHALHRKRGGGYLRIATRASEGGVEIELHDNGAGISAEVLPRVFEPFFTTKSPGEGAGLGLSLSLTIARDHGGDISISSEPGRGTTALLSLPCGPVGASPVADGPEPDPTVLKGMRILVVDDEPDVRTLVATALDVYGAEVEVAEHGREALDRVMAGADFDVILSDLRMPHMGGDELVEELRKHRPNLVHNVLLMTGDVAAPAADEAIRRSGRPCLAKPFNLRQLAAAILAVRPPRPGAGPT